MKSIVFAVAVGLVSTAHADVTIFNPYAGVSLYVSEAASVVSMTDRSITVELITPTLSVTSNVRTRVDVSRELTTRLTPVANPGVGLMQVLITEQVERTLEYSVDRGAVGREISSGIWFGVTTCIALQATPFEVYSATPSSGSNTLLFNTPGMATNPGSGPLGQPERAGLNFSRRVYAISDGGGGSASAREFLTFRFRTEITQIPGPSGVALLACAGVFASRRRRGGTGRACGVQN